MALRTGVNGSLPVELAQLTSLRIAYFSYTSLRGTLPDWIGTLTNLTQLHLSSCSFYGTLPSTITRLKRLRNVDISGNRFSGQLTGLAFPQIQDMFLQKNTFTGRVPEGFTSSLRRLDVSGNLLSGSLPSGIFRLPSLELFGSASNCLSTDLPEAICEASGLQELYLDGMGGAGTGTRYLELY